MHPHGTCDTGDDAGSHATVRTHAAPGRPGRGRLRSRPARAATVLLAAVAALLALPLQAQAQATGICGRTAAVRTAILGKISGVSNCANVTDAHLAAITGLLRLGTENITALAAGDFDGLTALTYLDLHTNSLSTLPAGVFDELTALTTLALYGNPLTTLRAGVFDELTALTDLLMGGTSLSTLRAGVFDELTALTQLALQGGQLSTLPAGVFDELTALTGLDVGDNSLSTLRAGVFDGLTALGVLYLDGNLLTTLPDDVFEELTALTTLNLDGNPGAPFSPTADALPDDGEVSFAGGDVPLDGSGSDGGPWGTNVTYSWAASGATVTFDDAASATPVVTIPALTVGTELTFTLTVTGRSTNASWGSAPDTDTATVTAFDPTAGICGRTEVVRDAIVALISGVASCADVTDAQLAAIAGTLDLNSKGITALAAGDFDGLTALTTLHLGNNSLSTLPAGVFDGLTALTTLGLGDTSLSTLPAGVFDELTALTELTLFNNSLSTLSAGVFDELTALTTLRLYDNSSLSTLPAGVFDGLTALTELYLYENSLSTLPAGVFDELTALTTLRLEDNPGAPFSPTADALPDDGTVSFAGGDVTLDGSGSGGPWGTNVTYSWALTSPTSGVTVTFDDAASATPVVTIPALADGTELTFTLTVTGRATNASNGSAPATDTATVTAEFDPTAGICGRTEQVRTAILARISGVTACADVTDAQLAAIAGTLALNFKGITALAAGDFDGLTALTELYLYDNSLSTLPAGVFDGLTALTTLGLGDTSLSTLPAGVFDELTALTELTLFNTSLSTLPAGVFDELTALTELTLFNNSLSTLSAGVFDELTALTTLRLYDNSSLSTLPAGVFDGLTALTELYLYENSLSTLPAGVFDGLTALTELYLYENSLSTLPAGVFDELTALTTLRLEDNPGAPFSPTADALPDDGEVLDAGGDVTLDGSGSGGPWGTNVTYSWALTSPTSGVTVTFDDAASATSVVTIPALADGTELTFTLTVTGRATNTSNGSAPATDTATVTAEFDSTAGICGRTEEVRDAIVALISGVTHCALVTDALLAAITSLDLSNDGITALAAGDFDGLTALTNLNLRNNSLSTLPAGVFDGLTALTNLYLDRNSLSTLPAGVFDELTALTTLRLYNNSLATLPAGVFDELTALTNLRLDNNSLSTLPAGVFDELTALTNLRLHNNSLSTLPAGVFEELTALTTLRLNDNLGAPFSPTADALPDDGTVVDAGGDVTLDGSGSEGGPWGTNVTYSWAASGATVTFDDAASATPVVTIPALADGTELTFTLTVTGRATNASNGSAPATDTATVTAEFDSTAGICGRTEAVRDEIVREISGVTHCANVTAAHLAAIAGTLDLRTKGITALAAGDFDGLTALTLLWLAGNVAPQGSWTVV